MVVFDKWTKCWKNIDKNIFAFEFNTFFIQLLFQNVKN